MSRPLRHNMSAMSAATGRAGAGGTLSAAAAARSDDPAGDRLESLWSGSDLHDPHTLHDKAARVRRMFDAIAPTYERVNAVTSAGRDRAWRAATVAAAAVRPGDRVLDVACGTGDLTRAFAAAGADQVVGLDFARDMLRHGAPPAAGRSAWCQADALQLPFCEGSFEIVSCAFGVRNFQDLRGGLAEMYRVLRPGGRAMICEFGMPRSWLIQRAYHWYFTRVLPRVATWISGDRTGAYRYLPSSVMSFTSPREMAALLSDIGFHDVRVIRQTWGVANVFRAVKQATQPSREARS